MSMTLASVLVGEICILQEKISDGRGNDEVREVYYLRTNRRATHPHFVGILRLGIVQGDPDFAAKGDIAPRYVRIIAQPYSNEADGRTLVQHMSATKFPGIAGQVHSLHIV